MLKIEFVLSGLAVVCAYAFPRLGSALFAKSESLFGPIARRQNLSVFLVGLLAVLARLAVLPVLSIPTPAIHDEFSYLLMADTFAHGRVANPTPPMWVHFETFQEIVRPTYVSIYYPAQGAFLAIGQIVSGNPFWGVVLSSALMCAAICWMLQGWMPPGWALLGGILAVVRLAMFSYWNDSYWGGAVAALGGALVLGALPRIKKSPRLLDAVLFAIGVGLLFNTRPYETVFFLLPVGIVLLIWLFKQRGVQLANSLRSFVAPSGACLALTVAFMGFYFWRSTGSPFNTPYLIDLKTYVPSSLFPWGGVGAIPHYNHKTLRDFYLGWEIHQYNVARSQPIGLFGWKLILLWLFYLGPLLTAPFLLLLLVLPRGLRLRDVGPDVKLLALVTVFSLIGMSLPVVLIPHYAAPLTCIAYALVLMAMRYLDSAETGTRRSKAAVHLLLVACFVLIPVRVFATRLGIGLAPPILETWASARYRLSGRADIAAELYRSSGKQLVIVRYSDAHDPGGEWVYNGADIDHEKVVWARDMGPEKNRDLINYFKDRDVWLVEPDQTPVLLRAYSDSTTSEHSWPGHDSH